MSTGGCRLACYPHLGYRPGGAWTPGVSGGALASMGGRVIDAGRLTRAIWLKVQPVSGGYLVTGGTTGHVVEVDGARITCHCPDAERMGDACKHSLAIRLRAGDGEAVDALRLLIPNPQRVPVKRVQGAAS